MRSSAILLILLFIGITFSASAQGPKVLVVTAHPDDETGFSVSLFKITHELKGIVDMAVMTDGGGGFADSQLGAMYYGLNLTDSLVARTHLPLIRKQEILDAAKIMGLRNIYFMEQPDDWYTLDPKPYISGKNWDIPFVEKRLDLILAERQYDFVITMLPHAGQHGHHKTAVLLALRAVQRFKGPHKPIIIAGSPLSANSKPVDFNMLEGFPETKIKENAPTFTLNRAFRFKENDKVSYKIVADWVIAAYKSQGAIQENGIHKTDFEVYRYFDINDTQGISQVRDLFQQLANSGFAAPK
ncbi:PIG-L family deacetylase [Aquirufa aurantiipilula]|uniref:PIG-L family deacetylase n=1 Tax=Aquirufa aurantiipilula TaxID=2696561 RepID=A0ABT6BLT0_9BACT|nr:PIG-L family deacetylase [Aquirufa aurantiipilula]MDF5691315.1 PIG-L family deacetylase [Aquirufa aurantiipilula]